MTNTPEIDECPPLSPDDKEILSDLLYPIFQEAVNQNKNLTRDVLRERLARYFFPWLHVREVIDELVDKDYISLLTTRGGGVYGAGSNFHHWQEEMKPIEYNEEGSGVVSGPAFSLTLEPQQVRALADLFKSLASSVPSQEIIEKVRLAAVETRDEAEFLRHLAGS